MDAFKELLPKGKAVECFEDLATLTVAELKIILQRYKEKTGGVKAYLRGGKLRRSSSDAFLEFEVDEEAERGDDVAEIAPYMFEPRPKPGKEGPISRLKVDKGPLSVGQQVDDW
eukprot:gene10096-18747_t